MSKEFIHDLIKIKYTDDGYLPDWPYHEISDSEMCDAFLKERFDDDDDVKITDSESYFFNNYPLLTEALQPAYNQLVKNLTYWLDKCKSSQEDIYIMPDWVYQYMLGTVISVNSDQRDKHEILVYLDVDNLDDDWTVDAEIETYKISQKCLAQIHDLDHRSATMFADPLVHRYLRLTDDDPSQQIVSTTVSS